MKKQIAFSKAKLELFEINSYLLPTCIAGLQTLDDYSNKVFIYSNVQLILVNIDFKSVCQ